jgi:hypothetical protein
MKSLVKKNLSKNIFFGFFINIFYHFIKNNFSLETKIKCLFVFQYIYNKYEVDNKNNLNQYKN